MKLVLIGLFGIAGVFTRYFIGELNPSQSYLSTFIVNIIGCFIIGICFKHMSDPSKIIYLLIAIGFCGGLTTFSGLILDCYKFLLNGNIIELFIYVLGSIFVGLIALTLGFKLPILNS